MKKLLLGAVGIAALLLAFAAPATAATKDEPVVVLSGTAVVAEDETVTDVIVFHGAARIEGTVSGDLVIFDGPATIVGTVEGDAVAFNGLLRLGPMGSVEGDVYADERSMALSATVGGDVTDLSELGWLAEGPSALVIVFAIWLSVTLSVLVLGLIVVWLAPRAIDATVAVSRTGAGPAIGWGLALFVGLPILGVVALASLVGIPFGIGLLLALAMIYALGHTASAWILGRTLVREPRGRAVAFLAGWAVLAVASVVPFVGGLVWFLATVFGLGSIVVATWRTRTMAPATRPTPYAPAAPAPA
jgi:cytoskeletal protein CcmA (bactofilin family)